MRVYCTRPCGDEPHINDIDEKYLTHGSTPQRYCSTCGMPLILKNQYLPLQELGSGGFGRTFIVLDLNAPGEILGEKKRRIVKQLYPRTSLSQDEIKLVENLFRKEAEVLEELKHPQIPQLYAFFELSIPQYIPNSNQVPLEEQQKLFYLVQEYIEGDDLSQELQKRKDAGVSFFNEAEVAQVLLEILDILKFIHSHHKKIIIHRDIKPNNIIRHQQTKKLYLIDFGAVKQVIQKVENQADKTENIIVTRGFSPPEQEAGTRVSFSSDLYSLAATCVNLLTGENPKTLGIPYDLNSWQNRVKVKPALTRILNKMLAANAKNRYQSADDVIKALKMAGLIPSKTSYGNLPIWLLALGGGGIIGAIALCLYWLYSTIFPPPTPIIEPLAVNYFSRGEESITTQVSTVPQCQPGYQAKAAGMEAFQQKKYQIAEKKFQEAIKLFADTRKNNSKSECSGDPETIIFLNNAKANLAGNPLTLFLATTSGKVENDSVTMEMLRGIAQAQDKINSNQGIKGQLVEVILGKDDENSEITKRMAQHIIENNIPGEEESRINIIGAIGHYTSDITLISGNVLGNTKYQDNRVPLISPSSSAVRKTQNIQVKHAINLNDYVFRVVPNDRFTAEKLAGYVRDKLNLQRVLVVFNSRDKFSISLKEEFIMRMKNKGVQATDIIECNLKEKQPRQCIALAKSNKSQVLMLATPAEGEVWAVINANRNNQLNLQLIGGDTVYSQVVLNETGEASEGMVVPVYVNLKSAKNKSNENFKLFEKKSQEFWGTTDVSWRTISTYDAMETLVTALQQLSKQGKPLTRLNVYETLKNPNFVAQGATAIVKFQERDRIPVPGLSVLFQVKRNTEGNLKFEPIE
ncbi:bifunctional serine/threonine-protein kinase/ABC transporter substrate-binding protein [Calothrix sp. PCC 6303]|uniref:bifunctional serine/threonine-protein kinase/ABC transporter substrate-binding protein n=1 Tax=Calothrix sp. PCC 6303 TaxID=1170562 RepID=UPI0002A004E4|nr:bifunctional serine/threonine-protein kinase/ABC transporter substrate-binding protein [Calothrix sp. PCC 6303]AFY99135.1 serine/threonine protein kinase [Calothrix sp. PCC 6303]